jgi:SulP family sulfate permease
LVAILDLTNVELIADVAVIHSRLPQFMIPKLSLIPALIAPALSVAIVGLVQGAAVSQKYPRMSILPGGMSGLEQEFQAC